MLQYQNFTNKKFIPMLRLVGVTGNDFITGKLNHEGIGTGNKIQLEHTGILVTITTFQTGLTREYICGCEK